MCPYFFPLKRLLSLRAKEKQLHPYLAAVCLINTSFGQKQPQRRVNADTWVLRQARLTDLAKLHVTAQYIKGYSRAHSPLSFLLHHNNFTSKIWLLAFFKPSAIFHGLILGPTLGKSHSLLSPLLPSVFSALDAF
jgi:hypothetical protein